MDLYLRMSQQLLRALRKFVNSSGSDSLENRFFSAPDGDRSAIFGSNGHMSFRFRTSAPIGRAIAHLDEQGRETDDEVFVPFAKDSSPNAISDRICNGSDFDPDDRDYSITLDVRYLQAACEAAIALGEKQITLHLRGSQERVALHTGELQMVIMPIQCKVNKKWSIGGDRPKEPSDADD